MGIVLFELSYDRLGCSSHMGETCGRCKGEGVLPQFSHVCRGICFRCWGTGEDVTGDLKGLSNWLVRARQEFVRTSRAVKVASDPKVRAALQTELKLIVTAGKSNRKKFDRMVTDQARLRAGARDSV
jgi:hypothetical protein